jgi:site-specific DNA recombinase
MKRDERKVVLRCAVYTRVSTESGLEQDFNSLDNQREASEAFIKSQAHEGWRLAREHYDDGGFSGGSMQRPALQKLLEDVKARKIDVIVVYKVDRLTRSLADFAKLVELFDAHRVSFISVTQAFNTTTSMGRLTLNMLLSFAQFEREITGERIRDKVAASKRKGLWMGGAVPLGYRVEDRALHVVESEAEFIRNLFRRYLELGSVVRLKIALDAENVRPPVRTSRTGRRTGGVPISRGHFYWILSNPIYIGRLRHKGQIHDGLHPAIVDIETWTGFSKGSNSKRRSGAPPSPTIIPSSRASSLMIAKQDGREPCVQGRTPLAILCVTRRAVGTKARGRIGRGISAAEIEDRVAHAVRTYLASRASLIADHHTNRSLLGRNVTNAPREQTRRPPTDPLTEIDVRNAIERVTVNATRIEIVLSESIVSEGQERLVTLPWRRTSSRRRHEVIEGVDDLRQPQRAMRTKARDGLVKALRAAHRWLDELLSDPTKSIESVAVRESKSERSIRMTLSLAFLSPVLAEAAMEGRLPRGFGVRRLTDLPMGWSKQWRTIGLREPIQAQAELA